MSASKLLRWGGMALLLGGVIWGLQKIGWTFFIGDRDPLTYPQPEATILWVMGLMAALFVLLGLPALYARQSERAGNLGLIAFVVVFVGMALVTSNAYFGVFLQSGLVDLINMAEGAGLTVEEPVAAGVGFLIAAALYLLGWIFFGLVSLRARVLPRWAVVLVIVGQVLGLIIVATGLSLPLPVTEIGLAWLGFALWREAGEVLAEPAAAV